MTTANEYCITVEDVFLSLYINSKDDLKGSTQKTNILTDFSTHTHIYAELFVCTKGMLSIGTDSDTITLLSGDAVIIPPHFPHHKLPCSDLTVWKSIAFAMQQRYSKRPNILWKKLAPICQRSQPYILRNIPSFCEQIQNFKNNRGFNPPIFPALHFITLLAELINDGYFQDLHPSSIKNPSSPVDRASQIEVLIDRSFNQNITVTDFANTLFISPRQLSRIIKQQYGTTLHKLILQKRLTVAAHLLSTTDKTIEEIAYDVGYMDSSSFYKVFITYYRKTPLEYRNQSKPL